MVEKVGFIAHAHISTIVLCRLFERPSSVRLGMVSAHMQLKIYFVMGYATADCVDIFICPSFEIIDRKSDNIVTSMQSYDFLCCNR